MRTFQLISIALVASLILAPLPRGSHWENGSETSPKSCCGDGSNCCQTPCCMKQPTAPVNQPAVPSPRNEGSKSQYRQESEGWATAEVSISMVSGHTLQWHLTLLAVAAHAEWSLQAQHVRLQI